MILFEKKEKILSYFTYKILPDIQKPEKNLVDILDLIFRDINYNNPNQLILSIKINKI